MPTTFLFPDAFLRWMKPHSLVSVICEICEICGYHLSRLFSSWGSVPRR
jgi:hypothetical protein